MNTNSNVPREDSKFVRDAVPRKRPPRGGACNACRRSLHLLLKIYNDRDIEGARIVSAALQRERRQFYNRCINDLHGGGFKLRTIHNLRTKHIRHLVQLWENRDYSAPTLQKYHSFLRTLERWIGKRGMVLDVRQYLREPTRAERVRVATADKSWSAKGIDVAERIEEVSKEDEQVAACLQLQAQLGLRAQEAWQLRPAENDRETMVDVVHGTKGGLPREVPVQTEAQRQVLELAKPLANAVTGSLIPEDRSLAAWRAYFYRVCRRHGISRKGGISPHGLRHGFANDEYRQRTGRESPVRGGNPPTAVDREADRVARQQIAKELGHGRRKVSSAYLGTFRKHRTPDDREK